MQTLNFKYICKKKICRIRKRKRKILFAVFCRKRELSFRLEVGKRWGLNLTCSTKGKTIFVLGKRRLGGVCSTKSSCWYATEMQMKSCLRAAAGWVDVLLAFAQLEIQGIKYPPNGSVCNTFPIILNSTL